MRWLTSQAHLLSWGARPQHKRCANMRSTRSKQSAVNQQNLAAVEADALPGLVLFARALELVRDGIHPRILVEFPAQILPIGDNQDPKEREAALCLDDAMTLASNSVNIPELKLLEFGHENASSLRNLFYEDISTQKIRGHLENVKHADRICAAAYIATDALKISQSVVLQEWLIFSEWGCTSAPAQMRVPQQQDIETVQELWSTALEPIGSVEFEGHPIGINGTLGANLAAVASESLPTLKRNELHLLSAWELLELPLRFRISPVMAPHEKRSREALLARLKQGINIENGLLHEMALCLGDVIEWGQKPQVVRFGQKPFHSGGKKHIVPCKDLPVCLFSTWLEREVTKAFILLLRGKSYPPRRCAASDDALHADRPRCNLEEAKDLISLTDSPEKQAELRRIMAVAERELTTEHLQLLALRLDDLPWPEISVKMGVKAPAARKAYERIMAKLKKKHGDRKKSVTPRSSSRLP